MSDAQSVNALTWLLIACAHGGCGRIGVEVLPPLDKRVGEVSDAQSPDDANLFDDVAVLAEAGLPEDAGIAEDASSGDGAGPASDAAVGVDAAPLTCVVPCENAHGTTRCNAGTCEPTCSSGFADCDGDLTNGCETNLQADPAHCGACASACGSNAQICVGGACEASPCSPGFGECDGDLSVTCETDLTTSSSDCGFCGNVCSLAHASSACTASTCTLGQCASGYDNCDGMASNGCESALDTPQNCGSCGNSCPANGGTPVCNAGTCETICDLSGTYALKMSVPGSWPNATYISGGSGTFEFWMKITGTYGSGTLSGSLIECGRFVPPFRASLVAETYSYQYANALFDHVPAYLPSTSVAVSFSSASPGASLSLPASATQMGVRMADPVNDAWPSSASSLTPVDDDMDGKPGVTALYENGGGYQYPRTSSSLVVTRADNPYVASRVVFALGGSLTGCSAASGSADVTRVDTRIFGCSRASSSQDCSSSEGSFLDQNALNYTFGAASYELVRIADGATCADVRTQLP